MKAAVALDDLIDAAAVVMSTYFWQSRRSVDVALSRAHTAPLRSVCVMPERNLCLAPGDLARVLRTTVVAAECMRG